MSETSETKEAEAKIQTQAREMLAAGKSPAEIALALRDGFDLTTERVVGDGLTSTDPFNKILKIPNALFEWERVIRLASILDIPQQYFLQ